MGASAYGGNAPPVLESEVYGPLPDGGGGGGVAGFAHHQTSAAAQWTLAHGLGFSREPTVLLDTDPTHPVWTDVEHTDTDTTLLIFPAPVTGWAYI